MIDLSNPETRSLVIVHGPPGAGKGTVAERFAVEHTFAQHISAGDTIRAINRGDVESRNTDAVREATAHGALLDDEVSTDVVLEAVVASADTTLSLVDGYPQRSGELEILVRRSRDEGIQVLSAVCLQVTVETSVDRMARRGLRKGEPLGDDADALEYYRQRYEKFMGYYPAIMAALGEEMPVVLLDGNPKTRKVYEGFRKSVYRSIVGDEE